MQGAPMSEAATFRLGILVSGSGTNMMAILEAAKAGHLGGAIPVVVISNKRDAPALERARSAGVEALCIDHERFSEREQFDEALTAELRSRKVEWVALAGFMRLLTPRFLGAFPGRVVNIHP